MKMMGSFTLRAGVVRPLENKPQRTEAWRDVHKVIGKHQIGSFHKFTEQAAAAAAVPTSAARKRKAATPGSAPSSTPRRKVPDLASLPTKTPKRSKKVIAEPPPVDVGIALAANAIDMWADLEDLFDPRLFASDFPADAGPIAA